MPLSFSCLLCLYFHRLQLILSSCVLKKAKHKTSLLPTGTITGLAFAPSGSLFLTEEDAHKHHSVMELTPSGQLRHFAGAKPDCGCNDSDDCTCPAEDDKVRQGDRVRKRS